MDTDISRFGPGLRYRNRLVYICVESPEQSIQRVRERVAQGGHDVPDDDVRRRYARSISNLRRVVDLADESILYDNSGPEPRLIAEIRAGKVVSISGELPDWAQRFLRDWVPSSFPDSVS